MGARYLLCPAVRYLPCRLRANVVLDVRQTLPFIPNILIYIALNHIRLGVEEKSPVLGD